MFRCGFIACFALLVGCVTTDTGMSAQVLSSHYCDSYFGYSLCVQDVDNSGDVDLIYFSDTDEIFMLSSAAHRRMRPDLKLHECIQSLDDSMRTASSKLLLIDDSTPLFEEARIKAHLMLVYSRYVPDLSVCDGVHITSNGEDEFGDEDFEDLML